MFVGAHAHAHVQDAYMGVRKMNEDFESEQEFVTDVFNSLWAFAKRFHYGWPRRDFLANELEAWSGKLTIGFRELEQTKTFRSHRAIKHFLSHYNRFNSFSLLTCSTIEIQYFHISDVLSFFILSFSLYIGLAFWNPHR